MFRFFSFVSLALMCSYIALATPATPVCEVYTSAQLTDYRMSSGSQGSLSIKVRCPDTARYTLRIESGGLPLNGSGGTLLLTSLTGPDNRARVKVHDVPLSMIFSGSRQFDLALSVDPGQWGLVGAQYRVDIGVSVVSDLSFDIRVGIGHFCGVIC